MKKLLTSVLLCGALLSLSACGNDDKGSSKEKELQTTIDSQSKEIKDLKSQNDTLKKDKDKKQTELKQKEDENKKKDEEIKKLKKVLASKKASNQQKEQASSSAQAINTQQSTQPTVQQDTTTPSFANEAEAEAYYDGFIDHESIARSLSESEEKEQSRNVEEAQSMAQSAEAEGRKITSAELQSQWLKKQGIQ